MLANSDDRTDPFMSVVTVANVNSAVKTTFSQTFMRHLLLFSSFASRLLEVRHPGNRMVLVRELAKIFEAAVDAQMRVDNKVSYRQVPTLVTGSRSSPTNLSIQQSVGGDEGVLKINGELCSIDNLAGLRTKLGRIYERGCLGVKVPQNLSFQTILVGWDHCRRRPS